MTRRSNPARDLAEKTWPIRVCIRVPELGFVGAGMDPHRWLIRQLGPDGHAWHSAGSPTRDVAALCFRMIGDAAAFLAAFPQIELAGES